MKKYAVIGHPVKHSKSPFIHQQFAKLQNSVIDYKAIDVLPDTFEFFLDEFFLKNNGSGCNITVPYKERAFQYASTLSSRALCAGAVNTLKLQSNGEILGDNTDGIGLINDFKQNKISLKNRTILIIGAGGATRGILYSLYKEDPKKIVIVNRTYAKALALASIIDDAKIIQAKKIEELTTSFNIIINATSLSLHNKLPAVEHLLLQNTEVAYDLMYADKETVFNLWAKEQGVQKSLDGLGMLVEQAAASYEIWFGFKPDTSKIIDLIRKKES